MPALNPDVTILHAQRADRRGNVAIDGIVGAAREAALAADEAARHGRGDRRRAAARDEQHRAAALHGDRRLALPGGAWPSYAHGYYARDNDFYLRWDAIARDARFTAWIDRHVRGTRITARSSRACSEAA